MSGIDLHVHTTASDGLLGVEQIMVAAKQIGLDALAITDHDTVSVLPEAMELADRLGLPIIPGVELSAEFADNDVHILGYWLDYNDTKLLHRLAQLQEQRVRRACQMGEKLAALHMPLDMEEIIASAGVSVGRPHLAQALVKAGYLPSEKEAFNRLLARGRAAYVPRVKFSPFEALELLSAAGAAVVVAHPGAGVPDRLIEELAAAGLDGIEVYHPDHDLRKENHYLQMARFLRLSATGGSDFHGKPEIFLGMKTTSLDQLEFLARHRVIKTGTADI